MIKGCELLDRVSRTSGSTLYRVRRDGTTALAKLLDWDQPSAARVSRLRREYQIFCALAGPQMLQPLAIVETADGLATLFEDFAGESLETILQRGRLDVSTAFHIAAELTRLLGRLHAARMAAGGISRQTFWCPMASSA